MMRALIIIVCLLLTACPLSQVKESPRTEVITAKVAVETPHPLPAWATDPLPIPQAKNGTVGAHRSAENARGKTIELANCHRKLVKRLSEGEKVDPKECGGG